jgi:hypothetical protein
MKVPTIPVLVFAGLGAFAGSPQVSQWAYDDVRIAMGHWDFWCLFGNAGLVWFGLRRDSLMFTCQTEQWSGPPWARLELQ